MLPPVLPSKEIKGICKSVSGFVLGIFGMGRVYSAAAALLLISVFVLVLNQYVFWSVSAGDKSLVLVKNRSMAKKVIDELLAGQAGHYGCPVFFQQNIEISPVWGINDQSIYCYSKKAALNRLQHGLDFMAGAVAIVIDGKERLYVADMKTARGILGILKDKYRPGGALDVRFEEKVTLVQKKVPVKKLVSKQKALEVLSGSSEKVEVYKVKEGDTIWDIARNEGRDLATLLKANKEIKPHLLQVGQEIKLTTQEPVLNVICRYEVVDFKELPYKTIEKEDSELDYGEVRVIQQGVPGKMEITYCVVEKNGKKVDKYPVKELITRKPRPRVLASGSKMVPASRSGRGMYLPVRGRISSGYGMRGGRMHGGMDFASSSGSAVVAMMQGTVEFVGYRGGYGLLIDIDHGNGMVTRYAHLSGAVVSPGDKVRGGELIGRVGSTGNSTGPHLHFEVRVNGETRNPAQFL